MDEVRAHWRLNKAIRWFKYRIILYQLTMYDAERLRRVRESGKTHQTVLKEKAVSSVSAIMKGSGAQSGVNQLQSFVTTLSHASGFIAAGLRFVLFVSHLRLLMLISETQSPSQTYPCTRMSKFWLTASRSKLWRRIPLSSHIIHRKSLNVTSPCGLLCI